MDQANTKSKHKKVSIRNGLIRLDVLARDKSIQILIQSLRSSPIERAENFPPLSPEKSTKSITIWCNRPKMLSMKKLERKKSLQISSVKDEKDQT